MRGLLLRLYPRAWRARYGEEFLDLLTSRPLSVRMLVDVVAAAVDARLQPQLVPGGKEDTVLEGFMKRCAAGGPRLDGRERSIGTAVVLVVAMAFAVAYVFAADRWRGNDYVDALGILAFPAAFTFALPFTYLKHHRRITQAVIVVGTLLLLAAASLGSVWLL